MKGRTTKVNCFQSKISKKEIPIYTHVFDEYYTVFSFIFKREQNFILIPSNVLFLEYNK